MNISLLSLTLALFSLSLFSCYSDVSNALDSGAGPQVISVDNLSVTPLKYSDHFEKIEYIPLQLVSDIPFGNAHNVGHYGDYYYVLDISKTIRLFIFDKKGQFVNSIGDRGNGKGKFYELIDFSIEKMTGDLYLLDRTGKINVYTPQGSFLREITITGPTSQLYNGLVTVNESIFLDINYPQTSVADKNYMLREISLEGEFKNDWLDVDLVNKGASFSEYATITKSLHATPNGVYYTKEFMDAIYNLESNRVEPFRTISSGYSFTNEDVARMSSGDSFHAQARKFTKIFNPANIVSGDGFFYFTYKKGASPSSVVEKEGDVSIHNSWVDDVSFPGLSFHVQPPQFHASSQDGKTIIGVSSGKQRWQQGIEVLNQNNAETLRSVTAMFDQKFKVADQPVIILYKLR